jgi:hypothetical protein
MSTKIIDEVSSETLNGGEPVKITVRLPQAIFDMNKSNGDMTGRNQTQAIAMAINLTGTLLKSQLAGKKIMIHDPKTGEYEQILFM